MKQSVALLFAATVALSSCAPSTPAQEPPVNASLEALVAEQVHTGNSATEALDILQEALDHGELTYSMYESAAGLWQDCADDLGVELVVKPTVSDGQTRFAWAMRFPPDFADENDPEYIALGMAAAECRARYFEGVEFVYMSQPVALEARLAYFDNFRDTAWECLREHESELEYAATVDEYIQEANTVYDATNIDCIYDAGYYEDVSFPEFG